MDDALLWKLNFTQDKVFYVFGTMHVRDAAAFTIVDEVKDVINRCDCFYAEMHLDEAANSFSIEDYLMPFGKSLSSLLNPRKYTRISKQLYKHTGMHLSQFDRFYPMVTANNIAEAFLSNDNAMALDHYLWQWAKSQDKYMGGIETVDEQKSLLKSFDIDVQLKMFVDLTAHLSKYRGSIMSLKALYQNQDIQKLYKSSRKSMHAFRKPLLYQRNKLMADRILGLDHSSAFIAVGAAHLAGFHGILRKIKNEGVALEPIKFKHF